MKKSKKEKRKKEEKVLAGEVIEDHKNKRFKVLLLIVEQTK